PEWDVIEAGTRWYYVLVSQGLVQPLDIKKINTASLMPEAVLSHGIGHNVVWSRAMAARAGRRECAPPPPPRADGPRPELPPPSVRTSADRGRRDAVPRWWHRSLSSARRDVRRLVPGDLGRSRSCHASAGRKSICSDHRLDRPDRQARVGGERSCQTCGAPARAAPRGEGVMREFRPPDAFVSPRFGGIPTFMRLPRTRALAASHGAV